MNYKNTVFSMFFAFGLGGTSLSLAMMERKEEPSKKTSQIMTGDELLAIFEPLTVVVPQVNQPMLRFEGSEIDNFFDGFQQSNVVEQQDQLLVDNFEEQFIKEVSSEQSQKNQRLSLREQSELRLQHRKEDEKVIQEKGSRSCQGARSKVHYYVASSKINIMQEELDLARKEVSKNFIEDIKGIKGFLPRNRIARLAREAFLRNTSSSYDVNTKFLDNWVPLFYALEDNDIKSMKLLLKENVDINAPDNYGNSLLHYAAIHSTPEMVKFLLDEGIDINAKDKIQQTPLFIACRDGKDDIVKILLERGAEVDTKNVCTSVSSKFPIKSTLNSNVIKEEIRYFTICPSVAHNAYPQAEEGYSPLHVASYNGHDKIVDLLLQNKVNKVEVDAKSNNHITSLHLVALRGHAKIAEKLRIAGADVDAETIDTFDESMFMAARVTPLVLATVYERTDVVEKLAPWANVDYQVGDFKATALHFASSEGYSDIAKILIKNNAKIELPLWGKHTAVDVANHYGKKDIAESLIAKMKSLKEMLWSSKVKNKPTSMQLIKESQALQQMIQPKLNIRADKFLIDACTIRIEKVVNPSFEKNEPFGTYYRDQNGQLKSVAANIRRKNDLTMIENHLANLNYSYCPKMRIKDGGHNFPESIEKQLGNLAYIFVKNNDINKITDRNKKLRLYVTMPGKIDTVKYKNGQQDIIKSKPGVFEFEVKKSLYESNGHCYHRLFTSKGKVGAEGFGAEFRKKEEKQKKLTNKSDLLTDKS